MRKLTALTLGIVLSLGQLLAQTKTITGKVTDDKGKAIEGASVILKNSKQGTSTNSTGEFSIVVPEDVKILIISYTGFTTKEISISPQRSNYDVSLKPANSQLTDIIVVGYGTQNKTKVTGAISNIKATDIKDIPVPSVEQAIQGKVAGVNIQSTSGRPGAAIAVQIRGRTSISAGNDPLYVVDGVIISNRIEFTSNNAVTNAPVSFMANINPDDIESIEILKDASAAAIYGSRASNGVVLITTKKGKYGQKTKFDFGTYYGTQSLTKTKKLLGASDYMKMVNEARANNTPAQSPLYTPAQIASPAFNTDWVGAILNPHSTVKNYQLSAIGGSEKTSFFFSGNYFDQDGILIKGGFKRYAFRLNLDHEANNWLKFGNNIAVAKSERIETQPDNSIYSPWSTALKSLPIERIYKPDGTFSTNSFANPVHVFQPYDFFGLTTVTNSTYAQVIIIPSLKFRSSIGLELNHSISRNYSPITSLQGAGSNGSANEGTSETRNIIATQQLTYDKSFFDNKLGLNATVVYEYQKNTIEDLLLFGQDFPSDVTNYLISAAKITGGTANRTDFALESYLGRATLDWEGKYILAASIRRDASSKFAQGQRVGTFPSIAGGWVVSNEKFLENVKAISFLKLRTSYGLTGNQAGIGNFAYRRLFGTGANYDGASGIALSTIGNPNLKWETTKQFDLGLEIGLLKNRINLSIDYYKKNTKDLLLARPIPRTTGFGSITENIGSIEGEGWDFTLNTINTKGILNWSTTITVGTYKNKVTALYNDQPIVGDFVTQTGVGQPLGAFYLIKALGVDPVTGDMKYEDINKDGAINSSDRQYLGSPIPKFQGGITNNLNYKGFDFSIFFQFASGNKLFKTFESGTGGTGSLGANAQPTNVFQEIYDERWTPSNPNAKYPRAVSGAKGTFNTQNSSRYLEDASYIRLKTLTLGYSLPQTMLNKTKVIKNIRLYVSGQNLWTITKYSGFDPEATTSVTVGNLGNDQGAIPQFRTVTFGANIGF